MRCIEITHCFRHPPGGEYCEGTGLAAPTGKCTPGYYCSAASPVAAPAPGSAYGGMCTRGYFCPEGSIAPQNCTPGYCCSQDTLSTPFSECDPGYYCTGLAILPNPTDGTTGNANNGYKIRGRGSIQCHNDAHQSKFVVIINLVKL